MNLTPSATGMPMRNHMKRGHGRNCTIHLYGEWAFSEMAMGRKGEEQGNHLKAVVA
jgi:hypothetical protein